MQATILCARCPGAQHAKWECPKRYAQVLGEPCPGFDAAGARSPGAWLNGELVPAARDAWKAYIARHNLGVHGSVPRAPNF